MRSKASRVSVFSSIRLLSTSDEEDAGQRPAQTSGVPQRVGFICSCA